MSLGCYFYAAIKVRIGVLPLSVGFSVALGELVVALVSDPEGPVYQAGTLLSFKCEVDINSAISPISYQW